METLGLEVPEALSALALAEASQGATPLFIASAGSVIGIIAVARQGEARIEGRRLGSCADAASGS